MTNHVHLLLTPHPDDGASLLMKHLSQRYVQRVNRLYQRSGTLWDGRYRSCLIQTEDYLLACYRYIEFNPVRAGMVCHPRLYRWSSYRTNAEGRRSTLVVPHTEYLNLGDTPGARLAAYRSLFQFGAAAETQDHAIRDATAGNVALGNAWFTDEVESMLGRRAHRGSPGRPRATAVSPAEATPPLPLLRNPD